MGNKVGLSAKGVVDLLMECKSAQDLQNGMTIARTGTFQSRSVTVGAETSPVDQIIQELGIRIKAVDAKKDKAQAEKLKIVLEAFSSKEKDNRDKIAKAHHTFSRRDNAVSRLERIISGKLEVENVMSKLSEFNSEDEVKNGIVISRIKKSQGRTLNVSGTACSLEGVIKEIGVRIQAADVSKNEPSLFELCQLKMMLQGISQTEKSNRDLKAIFHHAFSKRNQKIEKLEKIIEKKISDRSILDTFSSYKEISYKEEEIRLHRFFDALYQKSKPLMGEIKKCPPIYYIINSDESAKFSVSPSNVPGESKMEFYVRKDHVNNTYQFAESNGPDTQRYLDLMNKNSIRLLPSAVGLI